MLLFQLKSRLNCVLSSCIKEDYIDWRGLLFILMTAVNWVLKPLFQRDQRGMNSVITSIGRLSDKKVENHDYNCKYTAQQPRRLIKPVVPDCPRVARGINNIAGKVLVQNLCFSMAQVVEIVGVYFTDQKPNLIKSQVTAKYRFLGSWRALQSPRTSKLFYYAFYKGCCVDVVNRTSWVQLYWLDDK